VTAMLELGAVGPQDVVYDLGCGDGRIVIKAARRYGAAPSAWISIPSAWQEDLLATELAGASVVTLFLSPDMNLRLRPRLERELAPGARIVSHWHRMGNWRPEATRHITDRGVTREVFLWVKH